MPALKPSSATQRKIVAFDQETWQALDLLARDSMMTFQELADEAFRDLLRKHGRPDNLLRALKQSAGPQRAELATVPARRGGRRTRR